jgi:hypothetical protein
MLEVGKLKVKLVDLVGQLHFGQLLIGQLSFGQLYFGQLRHLPM